MQGLWQSGQNFTHPPFLAIIMLDGRVFYDTEAICHANVVERLGLDFANVMDGGYIVGDTFVIGSKDASRLAGLARNCT